LVAIPMHSTELPIQPAFSEPTEWQNPMQLHKGQKPKTSNQHHAYSRSCTLL
jgi:hypothetical protein